MSKLLEICEYESITCNKDYSKDNKYHYLGEDFFQELESLILTFNKSNDDSIVMDFFKIGVHRNIGKIIQARNYVGLIQMKSGFQIQILPKISYSNREETKKTFLRMLRSMKDFPSKVFSDTNLNLERMDLYEIFISMYLQEVRALIKKGLRSEYLQHEANLQCFKGKLHVTEHIKRNLVHKENFYVIYDEYDVNRPENRLIKSTLLKLLKISNNATNIKEIRQLLVSFETVKPSDNYARDFSKISIDRNMKTYEMLMRWSKVFLMNRSFTTFSGETSARALLFPMEKVFEAYVTQNLKKILKDLNWDVSVQDKGYYLFDDPKQFALRPDIVITRTDGSRIVLDTKWKALIPNPRLNYGISQSDMYQMYAYSKKYKTPEIWLLYPVNEDIKNCDDIKFRSFENGDNVIVKLFFVDVSNIIESLTVLRDKLCWYIQS